MKKSTVYFIRSLTWSDRTPLEFVVVWSWVPPKSEKLFRMVGSGTGGVLAKIFANSTWPAFSATRRGVRPHLSGWWGFAPRSIRTWHVAMCPSFLQGETQRTIIRSLKSYSIISGNIERSAMRIFVMQNLPVLLLITVMFSTNPSLWAQVKKWISTFFS